MPPNRHRLSHADVMILVGTSSVSLSIYMLLDNGLFNGQRSLGYSMAFSYARALRWPLSGRSKSSQGGGGLAPMDWTGWTSLRSDTRQFEGSFSNVTMDVSTLHRH
jgi:hypothetical protein